MSNEDLLQKSLLRLGQINAKHLSRIHELEKEYNQALAQARVLENENLKLQALANVDGLTKAYNHRFFKEFLSQEVQRAARQGCFISLILMDVDNFKPLNDSYGHQVGDAILRELCQVTKRAIREYDLLARYGGEEFAVVLPETDLVEAARIAERIRNLVQEHIFDCRGNLIKITLSLGVAAFRPKPDERISSLLIESADQSMLQAKLNGKNCVVVSA
ncbi:hypothetical protein DESUT3_10740 [Desulfuromonas versatilis]|uniref:diguanylate cyclase n=1 Tax=Desulfuromonas versatilis TaxID=2802975 RepID=A0ABN6DVA3_9BACT|nr:hypothetical protein DESUT3_10740 [Desulfuromonas versatilis]